MRYNIVNDHDDSSDTVYNGYLDLTPDIKNNRILATIHLVATVYAGSSATEIGGDYKCRMDFWTYKKNPDASYDEAYQGYGRSNIYVATTSVQTHTIPAGQSENITFDGSYYIKPFKDGSLHLINPTIYGVTLDGGIHFYCHLGTGTHIVVSPGDVGETISNGHIKVNNNWKKAFAWVKLNGSWNRCVLWKKISNLWKKGK